MLPKSRSKFYKGLRRSQVRRPKKIAKNLSNLQAILDKDFWGKSSA